MGLVFKPATPEELAMLRPALEQNARKNVPLTMRTKDTGFLATPEADEEIESLINQIKSIPCHYADVVAPTTHTITIKLENLTTDEFNQLWWNGTDFLDDHNPRKGYTDAEKRKAARMAAANIIANWFEKKGGD